MGRSSNNEARSAGEGHRVFAALYDPLGVFVERGWMGGRRERLLSGARGAVLEIGGGTGANSSYYGDWTGYRCRARSFYAQEAWCEE